MDIFQGVGRVAAHCGVSRQAVHKWVTEHGPAGTVDQSMPMPAVMIEHGPPDGKRQVYCTYGWTVDQLEEIRRWRDERLRERQAAA